MVGATRSKKPFGMMGLIFAFLGDDVPPSFPRPRESDLGRGGVP